MVQMVLCVILFFGLSFPNGLNCVKNDLTFVIDTTSDITQKQFDEVIDFVSNITNKLIIGINDTMVAVVTFNTDPLIQFDLDDFSDKTRLLSAINDMKTVLLTGVRNTHKALDLVRNDIYNTNAGARIDAASAIIFITYGGSAAPAQTQFSVFFLHSTVTKIYSIGFGNLIMDSKTVEEIRNIATDPDNEHVFYIESTFFLCYNVYNISHSLDPNVSSVDNCPAIPTTAVTTTSKITTEYIASSTFATTTQTTSTEGSTIDTKAQTTSTERSNTKTTTTTSIGGSNTTATQTTLSEGSTTATTATQTTSTEKMITTTTTQTTTTTEGSTNATTQTTSTERSNNEPTTQTTSIGGSNTTTTKTASTTGGSTTATTTHTASAEVTTIATSTLSQSGGSSQVTVISVSLVLVLLIFTAILIVIYYLPKYRKRKRYLDVIFILVNEYPDIENGLGPSKPRYQEVKHVYKNGHSSKFHSYLKLSIMNNGCKPVSR